MKLRCLLILLFLIPGVTSLADDGQTQAGINLSAIETLVTEPTVIENISIWVPAARSGPFINHSCTIKENQTFASALPVSVRHQKTDLCPAQIARILAELTSFYHSQSLPLAIFNGWQWEYTYSMCQYESVSYNLAQRGGCWENSWDVILNLSYGTSRIQVIKLESMEKFNVKKILPAESKIEVKTFSSMRTRNGYPKERQL
jgi:hypothetical protein